MKCHEAQNSLHAISNEFSERYFQWCIQESDRDLAAGFSRLRRFPSSSVFRYLDFVETLTTDEVQVSVRANLKQQYSNKVLTAQEEEIYKRWRDQSGPMIGGYPSMYVSTREKNLKNPLINMENGKRWPPILRKEFMTSFRERLDPLFGDPVRCHKDYIQYCVPIGPWYLNSYIDLEQTELKCLQDITARRATDLCQCRIGSIHFVGIYGLSTKTNTHLVEEENMEEVVGLFHEFFGHVLKEMPALLSGLNHAVPEMIEDANTWMKTRLEEGLKRLNEKDAEHIKSLLKLKKKEL